ncbi:WD repeat-containing protein 19 [Anthonomus grandis grandis]|uniref:WD repeat-containing protein 19 n=1 Tax=Anthonomus grandis grandis TaxID=2921223 RepID=UPI00216601E7|nr:WD repeat-containing protein 19 [Anthonomus grandis grandis]
MSSEKLLFRLEQPHGNGDVYITWQKGSGMYMATTGVDCMVNIFDRYGEIQERIRLPNLCTSFSWDSDGDLLGIVSQTQLILWDANNAKKHIIDVGLKDYMSRLAWSKNGPMLAVGTTKGNVAIYNHNTTKRIPIIGKHSKKITCGTWNKDNLLALGSEDKTISVSNAEGDTLKLISLRAEPADLQFSEIKLDERIGGENTISAIVGRRTLYLYKLLDPDNPFELAFQQHYGSIVSYKWYGDGYILIGFSAGFFISISTHIKEVGQELFQIRNHKNILTDISICQVIGKAASCGDNSVKIHDISNLQETSSVLNLPQESGLERISWSTDGQLLAVATRGGSINVYVSHMQLLTAVCPPRIAILSSLTEVSLYSYSSEKDKLKPLFVNLELEPAFIGVGQYHMAAGMNNKIWFYDLTKPEPSSGDIPLKLGDRQYLGVVTSVKLNPEYASVLFEGRIQLHMIEQPEVCHENRESIIFPEAAQNAVVITCHDITTDFLVYGTDTGHIVYFHIEEWSKAMEYKHNVGISDIFLDPAGTRLVLVDVKSMGYVFNGVTNELISIPNIPNKVKGVTWDSNISDRNVFIIYDDNDIHTFLYIRHHMGGAKVKKLGETVLVSKQVPLIMYQGEVMCATSTGQLSQLNLSSHDSSQIGMILDRDKKVVEANFFKQLELQRFQAAFKLSQNIKSKELSVLLAEECLKSLDIETALQIYTHLEDVSTVLSLQSVQDIEDWKLLLGYIAMFLNKHDLAQDWFLKANHPLVALEMRRDLLQWEEALSLAKKTAPDQVSMISREYAQQLEFLGSHTEALVHYEKALQENLSAEHTYTCKAGIARTTLHCGNFRHGISIAVELNNKQLIRECAEILDKKRQYAEAAMLFEKCEQFDKAASNYINLKNWSKVGELLHHITSNKIHLQYAKAKEREGKYEEAVKAYEKARDHDALIRLHLEHLNNPEIAVEIVQETKSVEGAKLVAKFFQKLNDITSAIKFLVLSKCMDDAFDLAKKSGKIQLYGEVLINSFTDDEVKPKDFVKVAQYFENERDELMAGKFWFHAKEYHKAMKHLLIAAKFNSKEKDAITIAIDVVASSNDESLAHVLIEFLLGDSDGLPKDPKYLFRLYMARKQYREASKSALIIANEEQINGFYRNAHDVLFAMYQELKQNNIKIPLEMYTNLMLLHSYILVRLHVKRGDHMKGARMLIRVANNISKFPSHIVPILTSTVIECHRAGLKHAAYKYATTLMNPEYRKQVDPKYAKKIEAVVRKPPKNGKDNEETGDPVEPDSPCPYCEKMLPESETNCSNCKNYLPFCIITGRHISKNDLTSCPNCEFPAFLDEFLELLKTEDSCPMCSESVDSRRLVQLNDIRPYLNIEE